MFYLFSLLTGVLIAVMLVFNGELSGRYGIYSATVVIHVVGLILIAAVVLLRREKPFAKRHAWFLYLGGAIGVLTTVFNNFAFGRISITAILALGLFGQSVAGLVIDHYGLWGMSKYPFSKRKLGGLALILGGIAAMINNFEIVAVAVSFAAGVSIATARTLNGMLADLTSVRVSTFFNYVIGLLGSILAFLVLGRGEMLSFGFEIVSLSPNWWIYLGGVLGVAVVLISNIVVTKVSAFYLTLLIFVGQVFAGITLDIVISGELSFRAFIGGALVAVGLVINLLLDNKRSLG